MTNVASRKARQEARKALDHWARDCAGYSDFDTYVQAGGSILDARRDITQRIQSLSQAFDEIARYSLKPAEIEALDAYAASPESHDPPDDPHDDDPPDLDNAQIQGRELEP